MQQEFCALLQPVQLNNVCFVIVACVAIWDGQGQQVTCLHTLQAHVGCNVRRCHIQSYVVLEYNASAYSQLV